MNQNPGAAGSSDQAKIKRRRHRKPGKDMVYRCLVCEDVALNYNFTVITCESCKAFFRRNVDTPNRFHCPNHYSCKVTKETRKHCPACRLKKCFDVGMRKELPGAANDASGSQPFGFDGSGKLDAAAHPFVAAPPYSRMYGSGPTYTVPSGVDLRQLNLLPTTSAQQSGVNAPGSGNYPNAAAWRNATANNMRAQMDSVAMQLGGVALSSNCPPSGPAPSGALRVASSTSSSSFDAGSTGHSETQVIGNNVNTNLATLNRAGSSEALQPNRGDLETISPPPFSSSSCALNSPFGQLNDQIGPSWAASSSQSSSTGVPVKHRLKRMRSPPGAALSGNLYESPASNASSASSGDACPMPAATARNPAGVASTILFTQPANCPTPTLTKEVAGELLSTLPTVYAAASVSASSTPSPCASVLASLSSAFPPGDSPSTSSTIFDRDGVCSSTSPLLSADDFKQALETCTRFSTMMQAPFSTSELGALMSNPLPENAFESTVYAEMALRRYVHSLKRLEEFARLDRYWQLFILRRALITAHSVNVGFYTDVERRAFLCPREDGSCLYLNEAYFYRTFDKMRSGLLDIDALMKPLMGFHVSLQMQFATQWTIVLSAMSLSVLFSTHYYITPPSSVSATAASSTASPSSQSTTTAADDRPCATAADSAAATGANNGEQSQPLEDVPAPLATIIQQFAKMAGVKLPHNVDLRNLNLASLAQHFPGVDLQALSSSFQQLASQMQSNSASTAASTRPSDATAQQRTAASSDAAAGASGSTSAAPGGENANLQGLEAFGFNPPPPGLVEVIEPIHRKYLYFLHDYVLLMFSNTDRAANAWRFCSEKLEEVRRIANVFTQQGFFFIAQNPQLGGHLVPLLNEIISSTPL